MSEDYTFLENLGLPESGGSFIFNEIFSNILKITITLNPIDFDTSCNKILLKKIDDSETICKISFIPINFLRWFYVTKKRDFFINDSRYLNDYNLKFENEIEEKEYLVKYFYKNTSYNRLNEYSINNIKLINLKKPLLDCELSTTKDFSLINIYDDDLAKNINTNIGFVDNTFKTGLKDLTEEDRKEWMNAGELFRALEPFTINNDIEFIPLTNFPIANEDYNLVYSGFHESFSRKLWEKIKNTKKRFIISPLNYNSHFRALIIDLKCPVKNIKKNIIEYYKFAFFFDSGGINPMTLEYNKDFYFLEPNMKFINSRKKHGSRTLGCSLYIKVLTEYLKETFKIDKFIFNTFSLQHGNSECGMFSITFLLFFILKLKDNIKIIDFKTLYFSFFGKTDLICSYYRGLLFFTKEDLDKNNLTEDEYLNSYKIYKIKNRKFIEFVKIFKKNYDIIIKNVERIKEKRELLDYIHT